MWQYYDLFSTFTGVSNYSKLDSLGRFEIKVPLINSTEVFHGLETYFYQHGIGARRDLSTNSYPELLKKHKALGDIAITDSEIATVEQWAKNLNAMTIRQYQTTDAKEQEEIVNAFSNSVLAKRATAIIGREDIAKMLKEETPLLEVYYAQHIADSMGCSQQQKDVIISKALLRMLERLAMPLNSYGLDLTEHGISSEVVRKKYWQNTVSTCLCRTGTLQLVSRQLRRI